MFLSPKELAQELRVSTFTVYGWISKKQIPYIKLHNLIRFNKDEIHKWLREKKVEPYKEKTF